MPSYKPEFGTYLKTEDLLGRAHRLIISHVVPEEIGNEGKKERKLVAHFTSTPKALVLNKTKCEALERLTGSDDTDAWANLTIVIRPGLTKYGGKTVGCIDIVESVQPARQTAPAAPSAPIVRRPALPSVEEMREPGDDDGVGEPGLGGPAFEADDDVPF